MREGCLQGMNMPQYNYCWQLRMRILCVVIICCRLLITQLLISVHVTLMLVIAHLGTGSSSGLAYEVRHYCYGNVRGCSNEHIDKILDHRMH
jgi:hypothetical protein